MTTFPISDVLSVTTGRLVSRDHIDGVYRVCNFMTGESLYTHALPRAAQESTPEILRQHPWLADIEMPEWSDTPPEEREAAIGAWLDIIEAEHGENVDLQPLRPEDHTVIDPITELHMMRPDLPIIIPIVIPDSES